MGPGSGTSKGGQARRPVRGKPPQQFDRLGDLWRPPRHHHQPLCQLVFSCTLYSASDYPYFIFFLYEHFWFSLFSIFCNWHIQWNENLALELSYDLGLGCSPLFCNSTDYDSSYPWIRLRFVHLMGVRPVQAYCWKTNVSISLPSPTSDNAMNMSIGLFKYA